MTTFEEMTRAVTCRFSDRIAKACKPLLSAFSLSHFGYCKITNDGNFSYLGSHVGWSEYFAAEKLYIDFPYYRHPKYFKDGISLQRSIQNKPFMNILDQAKNKFNIHHSLVTLQKIPGGMEGFCFASNSPDPSQIPLMLNELPLLQLFIKKFREENQVLFSLLEETQVNLHDLIGDRFHENIPVMPQLNARKEFLQKLGVLNPLTPGEIEIMKLLLDGYSAGKIAPRVFLAERTIEHKIDRIKEKLLCSSRVELIQKGRAIERFSFLLESKEREEVGPYAW